MINKDKFAKIKKAGDKRNCFRSRYERIISENSFMIGFSNKKTVPGFIHRTVFK